MKFRYKVTRKKDWTHLHGITPGLVTFCVLVPVLYYSKRTDDNFWDYCAFMGLIFLITYIIPFVVIYLRYDELSEGLEIEFDDSNTMISIVDSRLKKSDHFELSDISSVTHVMTPAFYERRSIELFPWDKFNYSILCLSNGKKYVITSLLIERLDLPIHDKYEIRTRLYPYPSVDR